jgi:hypothetical protein
MPPFFNIHYAFSLFSILLKHLVKNSEGAAPNDAAPSVLLDRTRKD